MLSNVLIYLLERKLACLRLLALHQTNALAKKLRRNEKRRKKRAGAKTASGKPTFQPDPATKIPIWQEWFQAREPSPSGFRSWKKKNKKKKRERKKKRIVESSLCVTFV